MTIKVSFNLIDNLDLEIKGILRKVNKSENKFDFYLLQICHWY